MNITTLISGINIYTQMYAELKYIYDPIRLAIGAFTLNSVSQKGE